MDDSFTWRGRTIHTSTEGAGPPLVVNHGTPFSSVVWDPIAARLATDTTIHRWDMPGYGRSSAHPEHDVDLDTQAQALCALVDEHWGLDAPTLIAHDIGGAVALRAHLVHGLTLERLVLVDTVCLDPWGSPFYRHAQRHGDVLAGLPGAYHRAILDTYVASATHQPMSAERLADLVEPWTRPGGAAAFYRQIMQVDRTHTVDIAARLADVACPVTVVWGTEDSWLPIDNGVRLAEQLGCALVSIDGAGHLVMDDQPDDLAAVLGDLVIDPA